MEVSESFAVDKMKKIAVLTGYGINCNRETTLAFELAIDRLELSGEVEAREVHVNQLIRGEEDLANFDMLTIPGGFLHGDDISAGKILAAKLATHLDRDLRAFVDRGCPVMGICNGFQVLVKYPLIPEMDGQRRYTLTENRTGRFVDRWVTVGVDAESCPIFLRGIEKLKVPIRHAEGRFYASGDDLAKLEDEGTIAMRYTREDGAPARGKFPANPNGSELDVAGICDSSGRIFGLMPHPEAFVSPLQEPDWQLKERNGEMEEEGSGLKIFKNVVEFLAEGQID